MKRALYVFVLLVATVTTTVHVALREKHQRDITKPLPDELDSALVLDLPEVEPTKVDKPADKVEGSIVLQFKPGTTDAQKKEYIESMGATVEQDIKTLNTVVVKVDESKINDSPIIAESENDYYMEALEEARPLTQAEMENTPYYDEPIIFTNKLNPEENKPVFNDPEFRNQWALENTGLTKLIKEKKQYKEKVVAVIDSGVCVEHPDLEGKMVEGYDFVENDNKPQDEFGHGCAVAGIIAANADNKIGIVGAALNTKIMPIRVLDAKGIGKYSDVANAIVYAIDHGADIINMSIGGSQDSELLHNAGNFARSKKVEIIASTGNTSSEAMLYPAKYESVISVGSVNRGLFVSKFSSHDESTDFFAPGESIVSLNINNSTKYFTGTSFATPYITSMLALGTSLPEEKGFLTQSGEVMAVNFDTSDGALGWGTTDYDPADVLSEVPEGSFAAQSSTKCVTRYSQGWYNGAYCYILGVWERNTNTNYQYQVVDEGKKYNINYSNGAQYLGKYVRVEVKYTGQFTFSIQSITVINRAPVGYFDSISDSAIAQGWALDQDTPSVSIDVHIYIGGPAGTGYPGWAVPTNVYRSDVNSQYGATGNHGFWWQLPEEYNHGTQTLYIYGINSQAGTNPQLSRSPKTIAFSSLPYNPAPEDINTVKPNVDTYGFFLPQGYNADILSEANQNLSLLPHEDPEDPVNTANGYLDYSLIDLEYTEVGGRPFEFRRAYNSDSTYAGILGVGWQANFNMRVEPSRTDGRYGWTIFFPDGHGEIFWDWDNNFRTYEGTFQPASSASKGTVIRYGSDYLPNQFTLVYIDPQSGTQYHFRTDNGAGSLYGKLIQIKYSNGTVVDYVYSSGDLDYAIEQTFGRKIDFTIDWNTKRLTKISDLNGNQVTYQYNANGRLQYVTNPLGGRTEYHYDANNRIDWVKDANGKTIMTLGYDGNGRVISRKDGNNMETTYAYSTENNLKVTRITDANSHMTTHKHNDKNQLVQRIDPNNDTTSYTYDDKGNRLSETLPDGKKYEFTYDTNGNRATVKYPNGYIVSTGYNSAGKPTQIVDDPTNKDRVKKFSYDANNNLIASVDAAELSSTYEYNANKLLSKTIAAGELKQFTSEFETGIHWGPNTKRVTGDVNGDGKDDVAGFGEDGVYVAISDGEKFLPAQKWTTDFSTPYSWNNQNSVRMLADVNGDGKDDIVGFFIYGTYVAFSTGNSFGDAQLLTSQFGNTWDNTRHIRTAADVNGDNKADLVGFGEYDVLVALSNGTSFQTATVWNTAYAYQDTWRVESHPRILADVNGDNKADIVGFASAYTVISISTGSSFNAGYLGIENYGYNHNWRVDQHVRSLANVNGDGKDDIVGMWDNDTWIALSNGSHFSTPYIGDENFVKNKGWSTSSDARITADVDGNGRDDILGFNATGVKVLLNNGVIKTYEYDTHGYLKKETDSGTGAVINYISDAIGNRTQTTDAENIVTSTTYNGLNKPLVQTDGRNNTKQYQYDTAGNVTKTIDEAGVETVYTYDGNYNVLTATVDGTQITTYEYDNVGNRIKEISPEGNYTVTGYDSNNRVTSVSNYDKNAVLLSSASTTYNSSGTKATETDANGVVTIYTYDNLGRLASESKAGLTKSYVYDFWANLKEETDWNGNRYIYTYDKLDRKINVKNPIEVAEGKPGTNYKYDSVGNVIQITDGLGQVTKQYFDSEKRLIKAVNPKGQIATYTYYKNGKLKQQTNFAGEITTFTYDANGNLLTKKDNLNNVTAYEYNSRNLNTKVIDAEGHETTLAYDDFRNNTSTTNHLGKSKLFTYDKNGNMLTSTDENGDTTVFAYDGLNKKISEKKNKAVNGEITEVTEAYTYDANGNMKTHVVGNNNTLTYSYNAFNKLTKVKNPDNTEKNFTYDANGNILTIQDENNKTTTFAYDTLNRKTNTTDPENHTTQTVYDILNRITEEKDARNKSTKYEYDELGNVTKVTDRDNKETVLTYDAGNRILTTTYPNGLVLTNAYDGVGRLLSTTKTGTGLTEPIVTSSTYDKLGNVLTQTDANGNVTTNTYDDVYRLVRVDKPLNLYTTNTYDDKGNVIAQKDENGHTTHFEYDPAGSVIKVKDALNHETLFKYDAAGNRTHVTDANGHTTVYAYNNMNRLTQTTGANNEILEKLEYDGVGNVVKRYDGNNYATEFAYNGNNLVISEKDALNQTRYTQYDENNNIKKEIDKLGFEAIYTYDAMDRVSGKTDKAGKVWTFTYDAVGNVITLTDPKNHVVTNTYDVLSRKTKTSENEATIGLVETSYEYDKNGNLLETVDPKGNAVTNTYNALNRVTRTVNDQNEAKEFIYDGIGNITQTKDSEGNITHYSYDAAYRKTGATDPKNNTTDYAYDNVGNLIGVTKPEANQEMYTYDVLNRVTKYKDGENNETAYTYDNNGNLLTTVKPNGTTYRNIYDNLNRTIQQEATPTGENARTVVQVKYTYDAQNRVIKSTNALSQDTRYEYDALDRLTKVTDALSNITTYTYDEIGNLTHEKNANNATTVYEFNELGDLIKETDPTGKIWAYEYDKNGNIVKEIDAKGQVNNRTYDKANRLLAKIYVNEQGEAQAESTYFEYDRNGNMIEARNANSTNNFAFDERSSIISTSDNRNYEQAYAYSPNGNLQTLTMPDGKTAGYTYNGNDKIESMTLSYSGDSIAAAEPRNMTTNFVYDRNGNLAMQVNPDNTVIKKTYDAFDRVTEVNNFMSAPSTYDAVYTIAKYNYTLNDAGDRTQIDFFSNCDKNNNCSVENNISTHESYLYDSAGRLTRAQRTIDNPSATIEKYAYTNIYTYDAVGNRTSLSSTQAGPEVTTNYEYNLNNQLLNEKIDGNVTWSYTYDDNGNRLTKTNAGTEEFVNNTWDRANNLTGVNSKLKNLEGTLEEYKVTYKYDALARRIERTPDNSVANPSYAGISKQEYVYQGSGWDMISEYTDKSSGTDVHTNYYMANLSMGVPSLIAAEDIQERTPNGNIDEWTKVADETQSDLDPEHNFIITPDSVQRIAYYQRDALDSIVSKTNLEIRYKGSDTTGTLVINPVINIWDTGKVYNQNRTDEYGKKLNTTQTAPESGDITDNWSTRGYSGQVYDIESATYYYGSRNYDPSNGTWVKADSYRGEYKNPGSRNRYAFVEEDPVNNIDKYGYSKTEGNKFSLSDLLIKVVTAPAKLAKGVNQLISSYKKDPNRTATAIATGIVTTLQTKSIKKGVKAGSQVLESNQQYDKAVANLKVIQKNIEDLTTKVKLKKEQEARYKQDNPSGLPEGEILAQVIRCEGKVTKECDIARTIFKGLHSSPKPPTIWEQIQRTKESTWNELFICMIPGIETGCDSYYAAAGKSFAGEELPFWQRGVSAGAIVLPLAGSKLIHQSDEILDSSDEVADSLKRISAKGNELSGAVKATKKLYDAKGKLRVSEALLEEANKSYNDNLTEAGRSLAKHTGGSAKRPAPSVFPKATGTPTQINSDAAGLVKDILSDPKKRVLYKSSSETIKAPMIDIYGGKYKGGVRYDAKTLKFIGLLEPL